jgi:TonB family C-terminal domain
MPLNDSGSFSIYPHKYVDIENLETITITRGSVNKRPPFYIEIGVAIKVRAASPKSKFTKTLGLKFGSYNFKRAFYRLEPDKSALNQYYATVRKIIESKKRYPEEAKRREEEGAVLVKFTIDEDGNVKDVSLVRSSDSRILDKETLRLLNSLKFPPPPEGKPMTLNLEIEYKLN